jgi:hypothetical protein
MGVETKPGGATDILTNEGREQAHDADGAEIVDNEGRPFTGHTESTSAAPTDTPLDGLSTAGPGSLDGFMGGLEVPDAGGGADSHEGAPGEPESAVSTEPHTLRLSEIAADTEDERLDRAAEALPGDDWRAAYAEMRAEGKTEYLKPSPENSGGGQDTFLWIAVLDSGSPEARLVWRLKLVPTGDEFTAVYEKQGNDYSYVREDIEGNKTSSSLRESLKDETLQAYEAAMAKGETIYRVRVPADDLGDEICYWETDLETGITRKVMEPKEPEEADEPEPDTTYDGGGDYGWGGEQATAAPEIAALEATPTTTPAATPTAGVVQPAVPTPTPLEVMDQIQALEPIATATPATTPDQRLYATDKPYQFTHAPAQPQAIATAAEPTSIGAISTAPTELSTAAPTEAPAVMPTPASPEAATFVPSYASATGEPMYAATTNSAAKPESTPVPVTRPATTAIKTASEPRISAPGIPTPEPATNTPRPESITIPMIKKEAPAAAENQTASGATKEPARQSVEASSAKPDLQPAPPIEHPPLEPAIPPHDKPEPGGGLSAQLTAGESVSLRASQTSAEATAATPKTEATSPAVKAETPARITEVQTNIAASEPAEIKLVAQPKTTAQPEAATMTTAESGVIEAIVPTPELATDTPTETITETTTTDRTPEQSVEITPVETPAEVLAPEATTDKEATIDEETVIEATTKEDADHNVSSPVTEAASETTPIAPIIKAAPPAVQATPAQLVPIRIEPTPTAIKSASTGSAATEPAATEPTTIESTAAFEPALSTNATSRVVSATTPVAIATAPTPHPIHEAATPIAPAPLDQPQHAQHHAEQPTITTTTNDGLNVALVVEPAATPRRRAKAKNRSTNHLVAGAPAQPTTTQPAAQRFMKPTTTAPHIAQTPSATEASQTTAAPQIATPLAPALVPASASEMPSAHITESSPAIAIAAPALEQQPAQEPASEPLLQPDAKTAPPAAPRTQTKPALSSWFEDFGNVPDKPAVNQLLSSLPESHPSSLETYGLGSAVSSHNLAAPTTDDDDGLTITFTPDTLSPHRRARRHATRTATATGGNP